MSGWMGQTTNMRLFMLGAGGHARSVADALRHTAVEAVVVPHVGTEDHAAIADRAIDEAALLEYDVAEVELVNGIGQVTAGGTRWTVFCRLTARGFRFRTVIHPSSTVSPAASLGEGVQVLAGAIVGPGATIGPNTLVNSGAIVEHDCTVGAGVHIAPGAVVCGGVTVGDGTMVGAGATVIPGLTIGPGCQLAAGAVVIDDVPDGEVVGGVPAVRLSGIASDGTATT